MVTLAPESVTLRQIEDLKASGVILCLGHSNAGYEQVKQAVTAGVTGVTHLFNAMSPLSAREPGLLGTALMDDNLYCGLIVDGYHVHFQNCHLALSLKPKGKLFLVTDAMSPVGTQQTEFQLCGKRVLLKDNQLRLATGELAGSVLDMATAVRNLHQQLQHPLGEALKMASIYPASFIGLHQRLGKLKPGHQADMLLLNNDKLTVIATWIKGKRVYST